MNVIELWNNWHTENNEDDITSLAIKTESNNSKALKWVAATILLGMISVWV